MEFLQEFLPIVIYILLIIILIIGIILGIKSIITLNKVERVVDDVNEKVQTLNGFFHIIDYTTDKIALATDKVVDGISNFVGKIFFNKKNNHNDVKEDENE